MSEEPLEDRLSETLLRIGLSEVHDAGDLLTSEPTPKELKRALAEAARGIELITKGLVAAIHWTQIWDQPGKADVKHLGKGEFHSASQEELLARLTRMRGIEIRDEVRKRLRALRDRRNQFEHLGRLDTTEALRSVMGEALQALIELMTVAVAGNLIDEGWESEIQTLTVELAEFDTFVQARMAEILSKLLAEPYPCPACGQDAAAIEDGLRCEFCGTRSAPQAAADCFLEREGCSKYEYAKDGGEEWPIFECPDCGVEAMAQNEDHLTCFSCGAEYASRGFRPCNNCRALVRRDEESMSICDACFGEMVRKDD